MPFKDKDYKKEKDRVYGTKHKFTYMQWWLEVKRSYSCIICGESHPACIDFHHREPSEKLYNIAKMVRDRMNKEAVLKELQKCDALCCNCHRKLHIYKDF